MGGLVLLFKFADNGDDRSLYHTVHLSGLTIISASCYYALFELIRALVPKSWGLARRSASQNYSSIEGHSDQPLLPDEQGDAEERPISPGPPREKKLRLDMRNIWGLVYGLGCVFYVVTYCLSGQQTVCSYFFSMGLSTVCFQELLLPVRNSRQIGKQRLLEWLGLLMSFISMVLIGVIWSLDEGWGQDMSEWSDVTLFSVLTGVVLPFLAPIVLGNLKQSGGYCFGDMIELCEFGLPFLFILAYILIGITDAQKMYTTGLIHFKYMSNTQLKNETMSIINGTFFLDTGEISQLWIVVLAAPFITIPCLIFITTAVLRDHASDPLIALSLVSAGQLVLDRGFVALGEPICLVSILAAKMALIARFNSTSLELTKEIPMNSPTKL